LPLVVSGGVLVMFVEGTTTPTYSRPGDRMTNPTPHPDIPTRAEREALNATLFAVGAETGFWDDNGHPVPLAQRHRRIETRHQQPAQPALLLTFKAWCRGRGVVDMFTRVGVGAHVYDASLLGPRCRRHQSPPRRVVVR
jgi:hypothetical protein